MAGKHQDMLNLCSYNIQDILSDYDILLIQELWLKHDKCLPKFNRLGGAWYLQYECRSAFLWRHKVTCNITPVELSSNRVCLILIKLGQLKLLLFIVHMPYDSAFDSEQSLEEILVKV